jgi:hypothetical protein
MNVLSAVTREFRAQVIDSDEQDVGTVRLSGMN